MRIAVLGWGSLVWDPRELHLAGGWQEGGPVLPIEFSRISDNGRLTLVIDEKHGVDVPTRYALSSLSDLDLTITDLQEREGAPNRDRIGFADLLHDRNCERARVKHPIACERIRAWAEENHFDAAVWTALESNFCDKTEEPFSIAAAMSYLGGLSADVKGTDSNPAPATKFRCRPNYSHLCKGRGPRRGRLIFVSAP
jgi:hypothetical protein